jgi:hypothetical protein
LGLSGTQGAADYGLNDQGRPPPVPIDGEVPGAPMDPTAGPDDRPIIDAFKLLAH